MNRDVILPLWAYALLLISFWAGGALFSPLAYDLLRLLGQQLRNLWHRLRDRDAVS